MPTIRLTIKLHLESEPNIRPYAERSSEPARVGFRLRLGQGRPARDRESEVEKTIVTSVRTAARAASRRPRIGRAWPPCLKPWAQASVVIPGKALSFVGARSAGMADRVPITVHLGPRCWACGLISEAKHGRGNPSSRGRFSNDQTSAASKHHFFVNGVHCPSR